MELSKTQLREGEDLIITCKVTGMAMFDIARIYREINGIPGGTEDFEISSNNVIASPLKPRYENIEYTQGDVTVIKVKINGKYECSTVFPTQHMQFAITYTLPIQNTCN